MNSSHQLNDYTGMHIQDETFITSSSSSINGSSGPSPTCHHSSISSSYCSSSPSSNCRLISTPIYISSSSSISLSSFNSSLNSSSIANHTESFSSYSSSSPISNC